MSEAEAMAARKKAATSRMRSGEWLAPWRGPVNWSCRLRERRDSLGLSAADVAHAIGVNTYTVQRAERGLAPAFETAMRLAAFFGCTVEDLWPRRADQPAT